MQFLPVYVSGSDGSRYHARHLIIMEWRERGRELIVIPDGGLVMSDVLPTRSQSSQSYLLV